MFAILVLRPRLWVRCKVGSVSTLLVLFCVLVVAQLLLRTFLSILCGVGTSLENHLRTGDVGGVSTTEPMHGDRQRLSPQHARVGGMRSVQGHHLHSEFKGRLG